MNRTYGSIKFVLSILVFTSYTHVVFAENNVAPIPSTFLHKHCDTFLTGSTGFTPLAFSETPEGAAIYQRLLDIVGRHSSSFMDILNLPQNADWSVRDALIFIARDRKNLRRGLTKIIGDFSDSDDHKKFVSYVLRLFGLTMRDDIFQSQLTQLINRYGHIPASEIFKSRNPVAAFVYANWKHNRSYVAEMMTAFELKGTFALSAKVYELIPRQHLDKFVQVFKRLGKLNYLDLEIDVVTVNPENGHQVWVEVKNVMARITPTHQDNVARYRDKLARLRDFKRIISTDPQLKGLMNNNMDFVWIIRGAGVDQNVWRAEKERGLYMYDRKVNGINKLIESRARNSNRLKAR